jgi:regulator of sirC expression with transglutaminase-like and TPR domain
MFAAFNQEKHMWARVLISTLSVFCSVWSLPGVAQSIWPTGGATSEQSLIYGSVYNVAGSPVADVVIQFQNLHSGAVVQATSDRDGRFGSTLPEGSYVLTATTGTQTFTEQVRVIVGTNPISVIMGKDENTGIQNDPTISAAAMRVPAKARRALQKAREAAVKHNWNEASRYVEKAIQLYPFYAEALALRGVLERGIRPEQALLDTQQAVENDPHYGMGYVALGSVYTDLGRFDDAIHALERALAMMPEAWQAYFEMSRAFIGKRNFLTALHDIEKACSLAPKTYPFLHLAKAQILIALNNNAGAATELEAYLKQAPNGSQSLKAKQELDKLQAAFTIN